jgi:hypothetical protein
VPVLCPSKTGVRLKVPLIYIVGAAKLFCISARRDLRHSSNPTMSMIASVEVPMQGLRMNEIVLASETYQ